MANLSIPFINVIVLNDRCFDLGMDVQVVEFAERVHGRTSSQFAWQRAAGPAIGSGLFAVLDAVFTRRRLAFTAPTHARNAILRQPAPFTVGA
jgi:hypothetical protein